MATNKSKWLKIILIVGVVLALIGGGAVYYILNNTYADTSKVENDFTLNAIDLLAEFQKSDSAANKKYAEKIITINGKVTETEAADSTINIKIVDTLTNAYVIFAFQQEHLPEAKTLKEGDSVAIKGSCSGGSYSQILETEYVTFKRCALQKKY